MVYNEIYSGLLQFDIFRCYNSLSDFSTTIKGGVSEGNYSSFNLSLYSGDMPDRVEKNRLALSAMLNISPDKLFFPYQLHSVNISVIDSSFLNKSYTEQIRLLHGADAVITNQKNICIGVSTADCVPVLIYDPVKNVLAAVHAGWRGTVSGIIEKVIKLMKSGFDCRPSHLIAGIGPSISQRHFEVGNEVADAFKNAGFSINEIAFKNSVSGKMHIDLWKANKIILSENGILQKNIEIAGMCTFSNPDLFFSARRQSIYSGRMVTGGVLL